MSGFSTIKLQGDPHEAIFARNLTDGLPVVPPTPSRVSRMLSGTTFSNELEIGKCPPSFNTVTVELVAVAAVMAGCKADHFPVVLAAVEAMLDEKFNLHG